MQHVRNVAIILALAAIVAFVPGGGESASFIGSILTAIFTVAIVAIGARLYRQFRGEIHGLGEQGRLVFYGSVAVLLVTLAASRRLFETGAGSLAWFLLIGAGSFGLYATWRRYREYGI